MKLSNLIVGMLFMVVIAYALGTFVFELESSTGLTDNSTSINESFSSFNKFEEIEDLSIELNESAQSFSNSNNLVDKLESLFTQGYLSILIAIKSMNFGTEMVSEGVQELPLDDQVKRVGIAVGTIALLIVIIVGVVLSTVTKREQ